MNKNKNKVQVGNGDSVSELKCAAEEAPTRSHLTPSVGVKEGSGPHNF